MNWDLGVDLKALSVVRRLNIPPFSGTGFVKSGVVGLWPGNYRPGLQPSGDSPERCPGVAIFDLHPRLLWNAPLALWGPRSRCALSPRSRCALSPRSRCALSPRSRYALGAQGRDTLRGQGRDTRWGTGSRYALGPRVAIRSGGQGRHRCSGVERGSCRFWARGGQDELRCGVFGAVVEEPAAVQVEKEDGNDEDDDDGGGEEQHDEKKAWFVGGKLLQLNMFQAVGKVLRVFLWVFHVGLDAVVLWAGTRSELETEAGFAHHWNGQEREWECS